MSAAGRATAYAAVLVAVFAAAALAGRAIDPDRDDEPAHEAAASRGGERAGHADAGGRGPAGDREGRGAGHGSGSHAGTRHGAATPVRGLASEQDGLRLEVPRPELRRGATETLAFRVLDRGGRALRDFDVEHARRMHAIVVRRDLSGFQHVHPEMDEDGTWRVGLRIEGPGSYRLFADFSHDGEPVTLAGDLRVDGAADLRPLPAPATTARSDGGDEVHLDAGRVRAGRAATLRFAISHDGRPVHVAPYLGADGHLVALREGDLAFLHVHPLDHGHGVGADEGIAFATTFPSAGRYRLFLQYRHAGRVHTAAFTLEVAR